MANFLRQIGFLILLAAAGCAVPLKFGLAPGKATEADVEARMGPASDRRQTRGGETVRYYSRLPAGREIYAARFGADGKLIAIEQRLTRANLSSLTPGASTADDVRDLLGPPYEVLRFSRQQTEVWTYPMHDDIWHYVANVEVGLDRLVREVVLYPEQSPD